MKELLETYRDRLTDLSRKNKSLRLLRLVQKNHFDLATLNLLKPGITQKFMDGVFSVKSQVPLYTTIAENDDEMVLQRRLTNLKRDVDLLEQETGTNAFHVAYGFLEGTLVEDFFLRSPILLYPARLVKKKYYNVPHWMIELSEDSDPYINPTLIMAMRKFRGIEMEQPESIPSTDVYKFLADYLNNYGMRVSTDDETVIRLKDLKADEIPTENVPFSLKPYAIMGKFRQSASTLLNDYEELIESPPSDGLLYRLLSGEVKDSDLAEVDVEILNRVGEADTYFVHETDASQEAAVVASRERDALIVHGPPGTGKSQVIVNLISDRLARQERVLLVCQKPVALEVVYNRLSKVGLQQHAVLVQNVSEDRVQVYRKMGQIFEAPQVQGLDDLRGVSMQMKSCTDKLDAIAKALYKERPWGKSLHYLYTHAVYDTNLQMSVTDIRDKLTLDQLDEELSNLKSIISRMETFDHPDYLWSRRKSFAGFEFPDQMELKEIVDNLVAGVNSAKALRESFQPVYAPGFMVTHKAELESLKHAIDIIRRSSLYNQVRLFYGAEEREFEHEEEITRLRNLYAEMQKTIKALTEKPEPVEDLTLNEVNDWASKIDQFISLDQKTVSRYLSGAWRSLRKEIRAYCDAKQIIFDGNSVRTYRARLQSFIEFDSMRKKAKAANLFSDVIESNSIDDWEDWLRKKHHALDFLTKYVESQVVFDKWLKDITSKDILEDLASDSFASQVEVSRQLVTYTEEMYKNLDKLTKFLDNDQVSQLRSDIEAGIYDVGYFSGLQIQLDDFDEWRLLDQQKAELQPVVQTLLKRCGEKLPLESATNASEQWTSLIRNSFLLEWIAAAEREDSEISIVSTNTVEELRDRYRKLMAEKRKKIPLLIRGRLKNSSESVVGKGRTRILHEAGKKRRHLPLRQMLRDYTDEMLTLVPCWLCTPDVVSSIFPAIEGLFDLVIFDEASQCPVENGVPAIYRAKKLVIAGDEKQMPPTSMFSLTEDDEADDEDIEELTRIDLRATHLLEWGKPRMASEWLRWHYRSVHDALINFSNYAYYDQRIQTMPQAVKPTAPPIEFIGVNGRWLANKNIEEAEALVDKVIDILQNDDSNPTLGIITFNIQQASYIQDVLERRAAEDPFVGSLIENAQNRKDGDEKVGLFVKNIENVQGDERDIVLFSVAYTKDEKGRMVSQFGSLSKEQGENRLNVAITRARQKVYIYCSFDPREWHQVEGYSSQGPKLLKRYLEYSLAVSSKDTERVREVCDRLTDAMEIVQRSGDLNYESPFEVEVGEALRDMGYEIETQVGFSGYRIDIAVLDPNDKSRYILAIECDGAAYHSSKIARERDIYRQRFLEQHGWKIHRVWSRNWWKGRTKELEKIRQQIEHVSKTTNRVKVTASKSESSV